MAKQQEKNHMKQNIRCAGLSKVDGKWTLGTQTKRKNIADIIGVADILS